jgi:HPt (histidine-containing phosphotransfer) domain-containing protein
MVKDGKGSEGPRAHEAGLERSEAWVRLAARYLRDLPQQLDGIRTTLKIKDYSAIKKQAHRIKGTSGTYRLEGISKGAARLERLAESENEGAIATTINKVMRLVELEAKKVNSQLVSSPRESERDSDG